MPTLQIHRDGEMVGHVDAEFREPSGGTGARGAELKARIPKAADVMEGDVLREPGSAVGWRVLRGRRAGRGEWATVPLETALP